MKLNGIVATTLVCACTGTARARKARTKNGRICVAFMANPVWRCHESTRAREVPAQVRAVVRSDVPQSRSRAWRSGGWVDRIAPLLLELDSEALRHAVQRAP